MLHARARVVVGLATARITAAPRAFARAFRATAVAAKKADHYSVLGCAKGADKDEIKKAYYKLVKK